MNGLERRLRSVEGVADLTIELGDTGLDGIRVRIDEGSDEALVLENIRRILVAYGLRSRRPGDEAVGLPVLEGEPVGPPGAPMVPRTRVRPSGDGLVVEISDDKVSVSEAGTRSPIGSAEAMVRAVARFRGVRGPERLAIALDDLDDVRVITMLARRSEHTVVSAAVCDPSLVDGLFEAADALIAELERANTGD